MAASTLIKWKPGKTGFYSSLTLDKAHWVAQGFEDEDDTRTLVFSKENNFTIVGDGLSMAQRDFLDENPDFLVKEGMDSTKTKPTAKQALTQAVLAGSAELTAREVEAGTPVDNAAPVSAPVEVDEDDEEPTPAPTPVVEDEVDEDEQYERDNPQTTV